MASTDLGDTEFKKRELVFGDEVKPVQEFADDGVRKYLFVRWCGNNLAGYGLVAVLRKGAKKHNRNGEWVDGEAGVFVFQHTIFVPKEKIIRVR
jgi:hypothetical protein